MKGKDRRALRALGHHLEPVVQIGRQGITAALVEATHDALATHELIKVRVLEGAPIDRKDAAAQLAEETGSELAQVLGRTFLLYKPNPESPQIKVGTPPKAALHGHVGGEGDRPAARKPRRAITQGAADEAPSTQKAPPSKAPRGPRASLPPRRHR